MHRLPNSRSAFERNAETALLIDVDLTEILNGLFPRAGPHPVRLQLLGGFHRPPLATIFKLARPAKQHNVNAGAENG
jgi:hypothetical protein